MRGADLDCFDAPTGLEIPAQPRRFLQVLCHVGCTTIAGKADGWHLVVIAGRVLQGW